jgi:hypothetical protein
VPLERLTPVVRRYDLGVLRLWQDELAEIVRLVRQLPDIEVRVESENNLLTDVRADLPQLGQRVSYFSVTATRRASDDSTAPHDVISVKLAKSRCQIEATEPDLTTMGLIDAIRSLAGASRRMPTWLIPFFRSLATRRGIAGSMRLSVAGIAANVILIFGLIFGAATVQHLVHAHGKYLVPWPASILLTISALALIAALLLAADRATTVMFTATRQDAPTFWQRNRAEIAINVVVGALLYLLGLLTAHL